MIELFERLEGKIKGVFSTKDDGILNSVYLMITKYQMGEPLEKNLKQAVSDALATEKRILSGTEEEERK
jgi:hypothetical protein